jgi:tRNA nucleotidyltransferase (CCA-adding enzyme)
VNASLRTLGQAIGGSHLFVVGGAVRDELLGRPHTDWDLATDLMPEAVMAKAKAAKLRALPTGLQHGTVTVMAGDEGFEITTFREDMDYLDGRHPEGVRLGVTLEEDLSRRDFTVNAMALPLEAVGAVNWKTRLVDPFGGQSDLEAKAVRAVGDPLKRFKEDGLRPLRACRFAAQLGFDIEPATLAAIPQRLDVARKVAVERVLQELNKLLAGRHPAKGLRYLEATGLLDLWLPELRAAVGCEQHGHHRYPVWDHTLRVLEELAAAEHRALKIVWAGLLHDVGKPPARTVEPDGAAHFYGHEAVSVEMAGMMLRRLKAGNDLIQQTGALVKHHGVHPDDRWSDAACRRLLRKFQEDGLDEPAWHALRLADQLAKGWGDEPLTPSPDDGLSGQAWREAVSARCKAVRARLERLKAEQPPLSVKHLALDGRALMILADRPGGPWLGALQKHLLEVVLEDPAKNTTGVLSRIAAVELKKT